MTDLKINEKTARKVLTAVDKGLPAGLGSGGDGMMCVQNVISTVVHGKRQSDQPTCVIYPLRNIGITLNDADQWTSNEARGRGLRRFAIAELGTNMLGYEFDFRLFNETLLKRLRKRRFLPAEEWPGNFKEYDGDDLVETAINKADSLKSVKARECRVIQIAEEVVQTLIELKTPGSKFLWLTE